MRHSPEPETKSRIAAAVACVREHAVERKLRIALTDHVDEASDLAVFEQHPPPPMQRSLRS